MVCYWFDSLRNVISKRLCRSDSLQGKPRNKGKARWSDMDSYILVSKYISCVCFWLLSQLDTKCIGSLLLMLTRKLALIGSLLTTPRGTCGVAIFSSKNGDGLRPPVIPMACPIVVST